jgi:copper chaperone CopZ
MIGNIGKWLVFGILIAGLIAIFIPDSIFTSYLNNPLFNMLIVLAIAVPTYTCATGSIPLAAVLMMKGLTPGAAFVFLMAGPATSIASITVIGKMLGRKTLLIYLASIIAGSVACGLLIDYALPAQWFSMSMMNHDLLHQHHHEDFSWFKTICSVALVLLLINSFVQNYLYSVKLKNQSMTAKKYMIGGMTCNHCRTTVENALAKLPGVQSVKVDLQTGVAYVEGNPDDNAVQQTVETLGYELKNNCK